MSTPKEADRNGHFDGWSDARLVRAARRGNLDAFDVLVERYQRRAVSVSYRLVGDTHDALEVCQEAFLRAWRGLDSIEKPQRFGAWLLRIVTNLSLNFRRDRAVGGRRISFDDCLAGDDRNGDERFSDDQPDAQSPGRDLAADELHQRLIREIAALPVQQRLALVLFSIEQLPQKEVAAILDCSVEAVKWHVFQARRRLRERLADVL